MSSASLALPSPTLIRGNTRNFHRTPPRTISLFPHHRHRHHHIHHHVIKASSSSSSSSESMMMEYDLYEILGIEKGADEREIKKAYRSLQKRCHPDIAGKSGHEMAIILNEIYALLSNPLSRSAYDLELAKTEELKGYTGRPMYSSWMGPETEERAVFVDEVRCVGCLKCALIADKTFAIESVYGRARVVAQWADTEPKIQESIDACPVNCISMVERSELAGLEFLMSKQPRGNVRIGAGNTAGARVFDVFSEVKVLKKRLLRAMDQNSNQDSKYSTLHSEARISAIQAIRSISNWFYWQTPTSNTSLSLTLRERKTSQSDPNIAKLKELAARGHDILKPRKTPEKATINEEYWSPLTSTPPLKPKEVSSDSRPKIKIRTPSNQDAKGVSVKSQRNPFVSGFPIGLSIVAMVGVRIYAVGEAGASLEEHIGGSGALEVVNSLWLQVILAGATWYIVGMALTQLVDGIVNRGKIR